MAYQIKWKSLLSLKISVIIIWIVLWNILLGVAVYFNDGLGPIRNTSAGLIASFAFLVTAFFCFVLITHEHFRNSLLDAKRGIPYHQSPFLALGIIMMLIGIAVLFN